MHSKLESVELFHIGSIKLMITINLYNLSYSRNFLNGSWLVS